MGSLYRVQTELIPLWKNGKAPHITNIELGRHGRYRTTFWNYAGANTFRRGRMGGPLVASVTLTSKGSEKA
ncbi:hypothetical protein AB4Z40_25485 [Bosea sp. 2YAB26]|uniref:hypothetical protein n=1 Tax=Bosea sp. 2YAB26 TaxID=3237478 RepID=UPI003F92631E